MIQEPCPIITTCFSCFPVRFLRNAAGVGFLGLSLFVRGRSLEEVCSLPLPALRRKEWRGDRRGDGLLSASRPPRRGPGPVVQPGDRSQPFYPGGRFAPGDREVAGFAPKKSARAIHPGHRYPGKILPMAGHSLLFVPCPLVVRCGRPGGLPANPAMINIRLQK